MTKETQSFGMTEFEVMRWSEEKGILKYGTALGQATKTLEEAQELLDAVKANDRPAIADAIGDVMVTLVNVAALTDMDVRQCFYQAYLEIKDRKGEMRSDGIFYKA
jgi:NTP pyrophosphatase (non-canonical NTP hydrolase)